jgi:hypothetical protein
VDRVGDDADLGPGEADRLDADAREGDAQERHGDALPRGEEHVHLAAGLNAGHRVREGDEVVRGLAHGGHHHDHVVAVVAREGHVVGDCLDPVWIGNGCAAVLLNYECHRVTRLTPGNHCAH